jgi:LIM domain kinase 1
MAGRPYGFLSLLTPTRARLVRVRGLRHPLVVNFMGVTRRNQDFYIVTEWVDGGNLRTLTRDKNDTFTWSNKVSIARDIAVAMAFLHGRGIIHR